MDRCAFTRFIEANRAHPFPVDVAEQLADFLVGLATVEIRDTLRVERDPGGFDHDAALRMLNTRIAALLDNTSPNGESQLAELLRARTVLIDARRARSAAIDHFLRSASTFDGSGGAPDGNTNSTTNTSPEGE